MNKSDIHKILCNICHLPEIQDLIKLNLDIDAGRELCVYPYLNKELFLHIGVENLRGVGLYEFKPPIKTKEGTIVDSVLIESDGSFVGFEIKGPSYREKYINDGVADDKDKLDKLVTNGNIKKGFAIGIILNSKRHTDISITLDGKDVNIEFLIEEV